MTAARAQPSAAEVFGHEPNLTDDAPRTFTVIDEATYRFELPTLGIGFDVHRLRRDRHELIGEVTVHCRLAGARVVKGTDIISSAAMNWSSHRARQERAGYLRSRSNAPDVDWQGLLEECAIRVLDAEHAGTPVVSIRDIPEREYEPTVTIAGIPWLLQHPQIIFADGGSLKSYLALYVLGQLSIRGYRVLLVDWELDGMDHRTRLRRLFDGDLPDVHYLRADRPIGDLTEHVRAIVQRERIDFTVYDSIGVAVGGAPESAELANAYFRSLRRIGGGSLSLAHITKNGEHADQRPFGSTFYHNGARATWHLRAVDQDGDAPTIAVHNRKANMGRLHPAVGLTFRFAPDRGPIRIEGADLADHADLAARLPLWQRMRDLLRRGAKTTGEIAEALDVDPAAVRQTLGRRRLMFTRTSGDGEMARIGLVDLRQGESQRGSLEV